MPKQNTKEILLSNGAAIMHRKGFQDSGILEVLEASGVPKGSFYYYFKSKEDFGLQVVDLYAAVMFQTLNNNISLVGQPVVERIRSFFRDMADRAAEGGFSGCPLGNLSQEMGEINEAFRHKLSEIFNRLEQELTTSIREAQIAGEVDNDVDPEQMAVFLVSSWEGALTRMKLTRDMSPFDIFERTAINGLLMKK
jgi:TetR/AcrR family transcriptional repressor of nem operon